MKFVLIISTAATLAGCCQHPGTRTIRVPEGMQVQIVTPQKCPEPPRESTEAPNPAPNTTDEEDERKPPVPPFNPAPPSGGAYENLIKEASRPKYEESETPAPKPKPQPSMDTPW